MRWIAGLALLVVVLGLMAVPWHMLPAYGDAEDLLEVNVNGWIVAGAVAGVLAGAAASLFPCRSANASSAGWRFNLASVLRLSPSLSGPISLAHRPTAPLANWAVGGPASWRSRVEAVRTS